MAADLTPFRRALIGTVVVLALLVTGFAVLDRAQGPKLSAEQVDTTAVVSQPAQTLRLFLNERIAPVKRAQVSVVPAAAMTVTSSAQLVSVQFTEPLDYATNYRVSVRGVTSSDDSQSTTLHYSFHTSSPNIYFLRRGAAGDQILRTSIRGTAQTIVYSAPHIQDFAAFGHALAVVTLDSAGHSSLAFVTQGGIASPVQLPGTGTIGLVRGNADTGILGFVFTDAGATTGRKYSSMLFTVDPSGTAIPTPVKGLDGKPLAALQWFFVPDSNYLIVQVSDESTLLLDTTNPKAVVPLGSYLELNSVSADGRSAVVTDVNGPVAVALPSGKHQRLDASHLGGVATVGGAAQVIPHGWLQIDSTYDSKTGGFVEHFVIDDGHTARELFHTASPLGSISGFTGSPNTQYAAVETIPDVAASKDDRYVVNGRSTTVTTNIVDIASGLVVKSVLGFDAQWLG